MPEIYTADPPPIIPSKRSSTDYSQVMRDPKASNNPLSPFIVRPGKIHMGLQEKDEKILILVRGHFITNLKWIIVVIAMIIAPIFLVFVPMTLFPDRFITATIILWYLLTLGIALNSFLSWFYNLSIITDERIIDIDFLNVIHKNVSAAKLDKIEDVTVQTKGALGNILNFGTIRIQTAAEKTEFEFTDVPHPQQIAKLLNELMLEEEQEQLDGRAK